MPTQPRIEACVCCGQTGRIKGRGLRETCHKRHSDAGTLADYPRRDHPIEDVLPDYVLLDGEGHTLRQIAPRLGMSLPALRQAVYRARQRGLLSAGAR